MQGLNEIQRHRARRTLSEVKQKLEEALRLSRRRDRCMLAVHDREKHST
ncbi:MAG TPA: hypothetical protein VMV82_07180 [Candidatus Dormibacteraeota bacterium]|nr:hypothetical protein [Candidatus Dormibacteraeota bacterium]